MCTPTIPAAASLMFRSDLVIDNRGYPATVVAFSGLAPRNHIFEWATALSGFPANFIGVRDPGDCWYRRGVAFTAASLWVALAAVGARWTAFVGGSAGGFAALMFGRILGADRIIALCPQSACGRVKRALGDDRWPLFCRNTPAGDIAGAYPKAIIHYAANDPLDAMHAARLGADMREWPSGGHDLPRALKDDGRLPEVLAEALR